VPALILASVPVNAEAGSYMTFGAPVGCFVVVATILYLLFSRPHQRIPPRRPVAPSAALASGPAAPGAGPAGPAGNVTGAAAAPGSSTAAGGASGESASARQDAVAGGPAGNGNVPGETGQGSTESTEASE
jgi:hypothetical protein